MAIKPLKTPFTNMSYTPDVPSGALQPTEYNSGKNIETDVRGIQKIEGDQQILSQIPGSVLFVTANFRANNQWWFIVATEEGNWYGVTTSGITTLTPAVPEYIDNEYSVHTSFTASWNGDVCFINDDVNPPMYLLPTETQIRLYDSTYSGSTYVWNYYANQGWTNLSAGFMRVFSAPNVGSVLVAGNLTYEQGGTVYNLPNTLRWSQAFGLNSGPQTWAPTVSNIANELEIPLRGPIIDGFALNGNFYVFSYWDCVVLAPIAYTSTSAPVFGVMPVTQGRGLLNENCWAIADDIGFGVDSGDIWMFAGGKFQEIGNQRVKNWFFDNLNKTYTNQVYMVNNTFKNQIEIYFPNLTSTGHCNQMLSYRYDLNVWNAPRDVSNATAGVEAPIFTSGQPNIATRGICYVQAATANSKIIQKDVGTSFINGGAINAIFERNNINFGQEYTNKIQVHRVYPEIYGTGNITVQIGGSNSVGQPATYKANVLMTPNTDNPWVQIAQNSSRTTSIKVSSNDATNTWQLTQATWQLTITEDSR